MKRILGYADRFSVRSGELIEFMVSSPLKDDLDVSFVRIVHGDLNPAGPGYKEERLESGVSGSYPSQLQRLHPGSGVVVRDSAALSGSELRCWNQKYNEWSASIGVMKL